MNPRQRCLACLDRAPPATLEAALWIAAEHDAQLRPEQVMQEFAGLVQQVSAGLPRLPAAELAQPLLRRLNELDFHDDDYIPTQPRAALLHQVLQRRRGQPLSLAIIALELAARLDIPLNGVNFPGHFLLRVPGADHLLDPCGGRRLYTRDCRELLLRLHGPHAELQAEHLKVASPSDQLQRLSRNLRQLHQQADDPLAALKDAERVLLLGPPTMQDHVARADIYQRLECPQAERYDLERALLLCDDPAERLSLTQRLHKKGHSPALH
ncbi:SirB1 family protein [Metapseudomonas boanensis]|uniref:Tetratricopeptide repeat protein n=1 Tax=Metapseudomonas boanensis TaxID=2822138 RepID=A0ABS5XK89_9GAMM|nr:transglutaminase family protein [Pseudomonas boanensis]MBT8768124.1 tetratricopeptide repeat protein [Pseudomonas boanensis]